MIASEAVLSGLWVENLDMDDQDNVIHMLNNTGLDGAKLVAHGLAHQEDYDQKIAAIPTKPWPMASLARQVM